MTQNTKQWALVTGASSGLGAEYAKELAIRGYNLILVARREDRLNDLAQILERQFNAKSLVVGLDLAKAGAVDELMSAIQNQSIQPQILINNAGVGSYEDFQTVQFEELANLMTLNMNALVELTYKMVPLLKTHDESFILNVASIAAFQPIPRFSTYAATKSFVSFFSLALREELLADGIFVTTLYPGVTLTEFAKRMGKDFSPFLKKISHTASEVVHSSLKALFKKRRICVPGFFNKLNRLIMKILPTSWKLALAGGSMKKFF